MESSSKKLKYKVLIVDDDKDLLEVLSDIFTNASFKVVTATDGLDATFKFSNENFDIILTDIRMPKKDGIKFVQYIQATEAQKMLKSGASFKSTPIILISASVEEYRVEIELLGNIEVLAKPFTPRSVMEKVLGLLEKKANTTSSGNLISFKAGEYVMKEGDLTTDLFYVKEGSLQILKNGPNGSIVTITTINAGEMIGEMGVLFNKNRSASILALSDCVLISIPKDKFESHLASQPKWFKVLFETISGRLEETTRLLVEEKARK
jgi:DNA-binding response OmpR family regulator